MDGTRDAANFLPCPTGQPSPQKMTQPKRSVVQRLGNPGLSQEGAPSHFHRVHFTGHLIQVRVWERTICRGDL